LHVLNFADCHLKPDAFDLRRCAQQPQPKHEAWPTRPGCFNAMPPLLTVLATLPDLGSM
jgi:hypothetical protein